jgi:aconitate decarboxylase
MDEIEWKIISILTKFQKTGPLSAAILNSTFIQGFELDDWHSDAPMHSNSILLPALFAAVAHSTKDTSTISGASFLLAYLVGLEVGPRVGSALYGSHMLSIGWHSGAVFGPSASSAAVSKLLNLPADVIEDAVGIACTQACGLMSAQFESEVKRMQHGFAARNGLFAALMAKSGYVGIKKIYERPYGGFLATFGRGTGRDPPYLLKEVTKDLGSTWKTYGVRVKPYAAMAGTHCTVDCIRKLQQDYPEQMEDLESVTSIKYEMAEAAFHHGGWKAERPITVTGAQMNNAYVAATQMVDKQILTSEFREEKLKRDLVWDLVNKSTCEHSQEFTQSWAQKATITFKDKPTLTTVVKAPRGVDPALTNLEILEKWRLLTKNVIEDERRLQIENVVMNLDSAEDVLDLGRLLSDITKCSL